MILVGTALLLVPFGTPWFGSFLAIARAVVKDDGHSGTALHPTVWSEGGLPKRRKVFQSAWELLGFLVPLDFGVMAQLDGHV